MSNVLIIGDGPLAYEIAELASQKGHRVISNLMFTHGKVPLDNPSWDFTLFFEELKTYSEPIDFIIEAFIGPVMLKNAYFMDLFKQDFRLSPDFIILTTFLNQTVAEFDGWLSDYFAKFARDRSYANAERNRIGWAALPPIREGGVIELTTGIHSNSGALEAAEQFFTSLGKEPVVIKDCVGGVLPRVVASLINNAAYALMEGVASAADIDAAMKLGTNYPFGPLEWADKIGLDQVLGILEALCETHGEDRYRPAPILRQLVFAGHWGERTGRGFYEYA